MFKKNLATLFVLFSAIFIFNSAVRSQETVAAAESQLFQVMLPQAAQRISPDSVPAEINGLLDKVITAGGGKFTKGNTEFLAWTGAGYKKANAANIVNRFTNAIKDSGWQYKIEGEDSGVTVFSALRESPRRRGIVGFYGATDEALIVGAMEVLPSKGNGNGDTAAQNDDAATNVQNDSVADASPLKNSSGGGSIVGKWYDGYASTLIGYTPTTGPQSYTPGRSHRFEYAFNPNGTYTFTGIMANTIYSCTTTIFNDQRGTYKISGNQITLTKTKNFFRRTDTCSAANFMERNHTLGSDTYTFSVSRNDSGKAQVCLNSGEGDACYERAEK